MNAAGRPRRTPPGAPARSGGVGALRLEGKQRLAIVNRLRRTQGQIGGIVTMLENERACADIVGQLSAAKRSLDRTGYLLLEAVLRQRLADPACTTADLKETEKLFLNLS